MHFKQKLRWKYRAVIDIINVVSFICERTLYGYDK